jgi:hypothetical protein
MGDPTIRVVDSDTAGLTLIEQTEDDGITVSRSWWHDVIPIEARLNPDAPPATEARTGYPEQTFEWAMPDAELWAFMARDTGASEADRLAFREVMRAKGRDVEREIGLLR